MLSMGCTQKEEIALEPLPSMQWQDKQITPFLTPEAWQTAQQDWGSVSVALRHPITMPDALETHLLREDRELWKEALRYYEQSVHERKAALVLSNLQISPAVSCTPPSSAFSLEQRSQLRLAIQLHRNVLWRLGRLEMSSRGISGMIKQFLAMFSGGRIKDAEKAVLSPIMSMVTQIDDLRAGQPVPRGVWNPGDFHSRMARTAHAEGVFISAKTMLQNWDRQMQQSDRWQYMANSADSLIMALDGWQAEFESLISAYRSLAAHTQAVERDFAPPNALVAWPCVNQNFKRQRILSDLYSHILPMQWALSKVQDGAMQIWVRLNSPDYASINHNYLASQLETLMDQISAQKALLSRSEDLVLKAWDDVNHVIWSGLPEFIDPIHYYSHPAVENAEQWNVLYQEIKTELSHTAVKAEPEPEQPLTKRGKPQNSFISSVVETLHAPSRIDEAERSLLAISELESHMLAIRDELLRLCKQGACRSFPEAEIAHSPRTSAWVVSWRQSKADERTLGHSLIVIKLCQLHLSRLVQRLTEIYAWFSETSNADLSWKKLKTWQRIWTLYAEPNGTYASFLRSVASLDKSINEMAHSNRVQSEDLKNLLDIQSRFFDLTIDYARFIDRRNAPPTSFDDLIETWEMLDGKLTAIEKATTERDMALHPELFPDKKRKQVDIPR